MSDVRTIAVATHGRYLIDRTLLDAGAPLLVGFHGYAEGADAALARLQQIHDVDDWRLAAVQALNRFYNRRSEEVIASWMTRQDRELVIGDNLAYVGAVMEQLNAEFGPARRVVFAGFSQGVAMAFRAACAGTSEVHEVVALGGDVPPEIAGEELRQLRRVLLGRGATDQWYSVEKFETDQQRLRTAGVEVTAVTLDTGHEWTDEFSRAASAFLRRQS